jgi:hypothetical protein
MALGSQAAARPIPFLSSVLTASTTVSMSVWLSIGNNGAIATAVALWSFDGGSSGTFKLCERALTHCLLRL